MTLILCLNDGMIYRTQKECAEYYRIDHVLLNHVIAGRRKSTDGKVFAKVTVNDCLSPYKQALEISAMRKVLIEERMNITNITPVTLQNTIFKLEKE